MQHPEPDDGAWPARVLRDLPVIRRPTTRGVGAIAYPCINAVQARQSFGCQRRLEIPYGIEHHLDDAFDLSPWLGEAREIVPEFASNRGTDHCGVEVLAFDGGGVHDFIRERSEAGLCA